jgi:serine protease AprX
VTAGAVALLLQKKPKTAPHLMREWIRNGAIPIPGAASTTPGEINVANTLNAPLDKWKQDLTHDSTGLGSLEAARGSSHVVDSDSLLQGESSVFGPFNATAWSTASNNGTAWKGGLWMGVRLAGDGWTGTSWASKTWAPATWAGVTWAGKAWTDPSWSGHYWSGHYWSSTDWSGHYWSASTWEAKTWTVGNWASASWG